MMIKEENKSNTETEDGLFIRLRYSIFARSESELGQEEFAEGVVPLFIKHTFSISNRTSKWRDEWIEKRSVKSGKR